MVELVRERMLTPVVDAIKSHQVVIITGRRGFGQLQTARAAASQVSNWETLSANGNWHTFGYLAGLCVLVEQAIEWSEISAPELIVRHQNSLKRLFPLLQSQRFTIPKDLTNTSTKEERTRFYHHEYQLKLLFGIATFLNEYLERAHRQVLLIIDGADQMSPTTKNLIKTIARLSKSSEKLKLVLIDYADNLMFEGASEIRFARYSKDEMGAALSLWDVFSPEKVERVYEASQGNMISVRAILDCDAAGLPVAGYLDATAQVDLYLSTKSAEERRLMLIQYLDSDCAGDDLISARNCETMPPVFADEERLRRHRECLERYLNGDGPLVLLHALSISEPARRLEALAEPSELLKCIGLYDTWFSYFSSIFSNPELRRHGSGSDPANAAFINAAFVLYSLGCSKASVPYLDEFYATFPGSKFIPTVLYAQSMTYGRYQVPVNLPLAEQYALRNLQTIDHDFREFEKYHYIKVFAENAYAYIKAKQGKYDEALKLCLDGNQKMLDIYGDQRFRLHQSILIYNTSQVYELTKNFDMAEKQLQLAISYDPYYGEYYNDLGNLLTKRGGRIEEALEAYGRAIELCPPYFEAHLNRGLLYAQIGDDVRARRDFERALEIKPNEWRALFELGNLSLRSGHYQEAISAYGWASDIEPRNADLLNNLGLAYSECHDAQKSISYYRRAVDVNPRHAPCHNNLAIELYNVGDQGGALVHAGLAAQIGGDPDFEKTLSYISQNARVPAAYQLN